VLNTSLGEKKMLNLILLLLIFLTQSISVFFKYTGRKSRVDKFGLSC